jgi:hypothetical protein
MTREALVQAVRGVLKTALTLTDAQVLADRAEGPRPAAAYLVVGVPAHAIPVGEDDVVGGLDGDDRPTWLAESDRRSTVSVRAFGATARDWLQTFAARLSLPLVLDATATAGFSLRALGGIRDLSLLRDATWEPVHLLELEAAYLALSPAETAVELATVQVAANFETRPDTLTVSV